MPSTRSPASPAILQVSDRLRRSTMYPPGLQRPMLASAEAMVVPHGVVLARLPDSSVITYVDVGRGAVIERVDTTTGEATSLASLDHGMRFVGPHVVVRDGVLAFVTDERIVHAFDLSTNERVMKEVLRSDRLLRLVTQANDIMVTYVVETIHGPRTLLCRLDAKAAVLSDPELEIEAKAMSISTHKILCQRDWDDSGERRGSMTDILAVNAEAASRWGSFGAKLAVIWERGREPLIIPGSHRISSSSESGAVMLVSDQGAHRISMLGPGHHLDVAFTPSANLHAGYAGFAEGRLPPSAASSPIARRLAVGDRPAPRGTSRVVSSTFLLPERAARKSVERVGRSIIDSLHALEERHSFVSSALMADVFTLGLEAPAFKWRLGSLGLTLRDPTQATWVVPGADPSLAVFGELAAEGETAHRLLAFYMYPARDDRAAPIVMIDPGTLEVTWAAKDFDAFFWSFLHDSEAKQPTTVDTILELLGRDASFVHPPIVEDEPPPWFTRVHGSDVSTPTREELESARAAMDFLLQERLLVAIASTDPRCDAQWIGRALRTIYDALRWPDHIAAVRRWATAAPRSP